MSKSKSSKPRKKYLWGAVVGAIAGAAWFLYWEQRLPQNPTPEIPAPKAKAPNIVLIVVDTLRADHMGLYGYRRPTTPHLDRWFSPGLVYDAAYATMSFTPPSVVSLLSGLYPMNHRVRMVFQKLPDKVAVIPDYLKTAGYHTAAVVSNMVLTQEATELGARFDYFDDYVDEPVPVRKGFERNAGRTTDAALAWLGQAQWLEQPHFLWLHYMDPHGPYAPSPEKPISFDHPEPLPIDTERIPVYNRLGSDDGYHYVDRYDEEIAYVDQEIDRFLSAYRDAGLLDDAVVIFTSDHGEYMMDHEKWFTHGYHVYQACTRVPLMILKPGATAQRLPNPVSLVDLAPTLLAVAGIDAQPNFDGISLFEPEARDVFVEGLGSGRGQQFRGLVRGQRKWVIYSENGKELSEYRRFYDLAADPGETEPKTWEEAEPAPPELLGALARDPDPSGLPRSVKAGSRLTQAKAKPENGLPVVVEGLDEETLERLRALGYVQ